MNEPTLPTTVAATMHLLVDGVCMCCLCLLSSTFWESGIVVVFLTYNVLAFLTQPFTGLLADAIARLHWMLLAALLLLTAGVVATQVAMWQGPTAVRLFAAATLLGMGNSLFHVWGGKQVAVKSGNGMRSLGVFVSTGAMGLSLGYVFSSWWLLGAFLLALCGLACAYLHIDGMEEVVLETEAKARQEATAETKPRHYAVGLAIAAIAALMAIVMLRSMAGESFSAVMAGGSMVVLTVGAMSMLGKMAGGWIAHRFGIVSSMAVVVVLGAACLAMRHTGPWVALAGLFLVNCTMPVTLFLANAVLKGHEGLAFGLLAAALIPGYLMATI